MENNENLNDHTQQKELNESGNTDSMMSTGVGDKEKPKLEPKKVSIQSASIKEAGKKKNLIVSCVCKHPDKDDTIEISKVEYKDDKKLKQVGLWVTLDEDEKIQKGTALAILLNFLRSPSIRSLSGKECDTVEGDDGFLCLRAY